MNRRVLAIMLSSLLGVSVAMVVHWKVKRPVSFPHAGWTIYLNDVLGLREIDPSFGASSLLNNTRTELFIRRVARKSRDFFSENDRDIDVYMIPFVGGESYNRGWPFLSGHAETRVFIESAETSQLESQLMFTITEDGGPSFRMSAFLLNGVIYAIIIYCAFFLYLYAYRRFFTRNVTGFPVIVD